MSAHLIAILDDDPSVRASLSSLVRSYGYTARVFGSAEEFLSSGAPVETAVIITDVQMTGMTGIDLKVRLAELGCTCPVVMITAQTDPDVLDRARNLGAFCLISKPFRAEKLITCLQNAMTAWLAAPQHH